jgi:hypothetical protein
LVYMNFVMRAVKIYLYVEHVRDDQFLSICITIQDQEINDLSVTTMDLMVQHPESIIEIMKLDSTDTRSIDA